MSRARFESKLMPASTAYRMTFYRHQLAKPNQPRSRLAESKSFTCAAMFAKSQVNEGLLSSTGRNRNLAPQRGSSPAEKKLPDNEFRTWSS